MLMGVLDTVAREVTSLVVAAVRLPRALGRRTPCLTEVPLQISPAAKRNETPVVLLHGYLGTEATWASLTGRLHSAGYVNVFTLGYDSLSAGVPELAAWLVDAARGVMKRAGQPRVHLIGHSLGGLIARYAVQELGLDTATRSVVTVGTPHRGTLLARLGPGPAAAQLRPRSTLLRHLPPLEQTHGVQWVVIYGSADIVAPAPHSIGELSVAGYGHHSILHSTELATAVVAHLVETDSPAMRSCGLPNLSDSRADESRRAPVRDEGTGACTAAEDLATAV
jgi:pimeloyl-ACP methyl ester carboxylesterase